MKSPQYNSRSWTGDIDTSPESKQPERPIGPFQMGLACAALVAFLAFATFKLSCSAMFSVTKDMLVDVPMTAFALAIVPLALSSGIRAPLVFRSAGKRPQTRRLDLLVEPALAVMLGIAFAMVGAITHGSAKLGPLERAQVEGFSNRKMQSTATIGFADGSWVTTGDYPASESVPFGRCLLVRQVTGRYGFSWVKIVDASPIPAPNRLATRVEASDCFSDIPLADLGRQSALPDR